MRRTGKWKVYCTCCLALLCLFTSCATKETEFIEVSVPRLVAVDIDDLVDPVLKQRPDNSLLEINAGPILELCDVVENSATYLHAWSMWQNYAETLEDTIATISSRLKSVQ